MKTDNKISDLTTKELHWREGILTLVDERDPLLRRFGQLDYIKLSSGKSITIERKRADEIWSIVSGKSFMTLEDCREESPSFGSTLEVVINGESPHAVLVPFGVKCQITAQSTSGLIRLTTEQDQNGSGDNLP